MPVDLSQLELPTVSPEGLRVLDIIASNEPDLKLLEKTILSDPTLASTLIKFANSPLYRRANRVSNIPTAIRILGLRNIRSAVAMATMRSIADPDNPISRAILNHNQEISLLCKLIAREFAPEIADDMAFLGLIHDMGMLILNQSFPDEYRQLFDQAANEQLEVNALEGQHLEITHDIIMAAVSERFRLPENYVDTLANYHTHKAVSSTEQLPNLYLCILDLAHHLWPEISDEQPHFSEVIVEGREKLSILLDLKEPKLQQIIEIARALLSSGEE